MIYFFIFSSILEFYNFPSVIDLFWLLLLSVVRGGSWRSEERLIATIPPRNSPVRPLENVWRWGRLAQNSPIHLSSIQIRSGSIDKVQPCLCNPLIQPTHLPSHLNFTLLFLSSLWSDLRMWGPFLIVLNLRNPNLILACTTQRCKAH